MLESALLSGNTMDCKEEKTQNEERSTTSFEQDAIDARLILENAPEGFRVARRKLYATEQDAIDDVRCIAFEDLPPPRIPGLQIVGGDYNDTVRDRERRHFLREMYKTGGSVGGSSTTVGVRW